ncbi:MAG: thiamine pyrophosphate-binding protein [Haloarculaceae archaeon]
MSERTGADLVADALGQYGVGHVFGNPGTTELAVLRAIGDHGPAYVQALHEDVAVGMAAGYAATRRYHAHRDGSVTPLGVASLHVTPGLAHGLGNIYAAGWTGAPLLVTAGNHERDFRSREPILTGDLLDLVASVTKYHEEVLSVAALPRLLRRAVREALSPPQGPVFLALPQDVMEEPTALDPEPLGEIPSPGAGDRDALDRAADALVAAESPALILGDGVARSAGGIDAAVALAEATGARVHGEILYSETVFPQDHPQWVSPVPPEEDLARLLLSTDTLALVGTSSNTTILRNEAPLVDADTTGIHVGLDPHELGKNYPTDVAVQGDPALAMEAIAERVGTRLDEETRTARLESVEATAAALAPTIREMGESEAPDDPRPSKAEVVDAIAAVVPDAYVVDEGVTAKYALLTRWPFTGQDLLSSKSGGLGFGLPASVGAALAETVRADASGADSADDSRVDGDGGRTVLAHVGDGAYQYYPQAIGAAVRLDLDLTVLVQNNGTYHILERNAETLYGEGAAESVPGLDLTGIDLVASAESYGAHGHRVDDPDDLEATFEAAVEHDGVDLVDVLVHD